MIRWVNTFNFHILVFWIEESSLSEWVLEPRKLFGWFCQFQSQVKVCQSSKDNGNELNGLSEFWEAQGIFGNYQRWQITRWAREQKSKIWPRAPVVQVFNYRTQKELFKSLLWLGCKRENNFGSRFQDLKIPSQFQNVQLFLNTKGFEKLKGLCWKFQLWKF